MYNEIQEKGDELRMIYNQFEYAQLSEQQDGDASFADDYNEDIAKAESEQWEFIKKSLIYADLEDRMNVVRNEYDEELSDEECLSPEESKEECEDTRR